MHFNLGIYIFKCDSTHVSSLHFSNYFNFAVRVLAYTTVADL